jgi:hypothetical protein
MVCGGSAVGGREGGREGRISELLVRSSEAGAGGGARQPARQEIKQHKAGRCVLVLWLTLLCVYVYVCMAVRLRG